jgi:hypothetical protein
VANLRIFTKLSELSQIKRYRLILGHRVSCLSGEYAFEFTRYLVKNLFCPRIWKSLDCAAVGWGGPSLVWSISPASPSALPYAISCASSSQDMSQLLSHHLAIVNGETIVEIWARAGRVMHSCHLRHCSIQCAVRWANRGWLKQSTENFCICFSDTDEFHISPSNCFVTGVERSHFPRCSQSLTHSIASAAEILQSHFSTVLPGG